jgi:HlyD family secretion protein
MQTERKQLDRRWLWMGAVVVIVLVFFASRALTRDRLPVRVAQVSRQSLESRISTNGRVEPEANYEIHSTVSAIVKAMYVRPGDVVPAGKLLLQLDDVEARARVASAENAVKTAQAALEAVMQNGTIEQRQAATADVARNKLERDQAQRDLAALSRLSATGAASPSEIEASQQRLATAEANLHAAEQSVQSRYSPAEVARAKAALADAEAGRKAAEAVLAQTSVHAPVAGTIYSLNTGATEFAEAGKLLLEMADLRHERVRAYFDEPEIGRLAVGQKIEIKWDAKPGVAWHGHIERVPITVITYGTRTVGEVLIDVDGNESTQLLPDTNVTVTVTTSSESNVLSMPREALHSESGKSYVFKVENDELVRTPVTIGTINLTQVAVVSGLKEGDLVATGTTNGQPLQEGVAIKSVP